MVTRAIDFIEQPARGLELPLNIQGTAFQHRVWQKLREILIGQTRSYSQIAVALHPTRLKLVHQLHRESKRCKGL